MRVHAGLNKTAYFTGNPEYSNPAYSFTMYRGSGHVVCEAGSERFWLNRWRSYQSKTA